MDRPSLRFRGERDRRRAARPRVQGHSSRRRDRSRGRRRGDLRLPRPERGGKVDDRPHADHADAAHRRPRSRRRVRRRQGRPEGARADRRGAPGGCARPVSDGPRPRRLQASLHGLSRENARAGRRAARAGRPAERRRPQGAHVLGRDEAPPRPGARAPPPARRSCSSTSRRPGSTRRAAARSGSRWRDSRARTASPSSSRLSTSRRRTCSRTASGSSTRANRRGRHAVELKAEIGRPTVQVAPADARRA